ncbi:MAG: hypothetical protein U1E46_10080 [Hyphomicrobiales bacterium]
MLSGDPKKVQKARAFIIEQRKLAALAGTIDLVDGSKRWLSHDGKAFKKSFFLKILKDADAFLLNAPGLWEVQSRSARILRLAGRFEEAYGLYNASIEALRSSAEHQSELCDIIADYAEYLVYLGYPEEAIEQLDSIHGIDAPQKAWYDWVRGFALHQLAFSAEHPIGSATGYNPLGASAAYGASIEVLNGVIKVKGPLALDPAQVADVHLLIAANYGARIRLGLSGAREKAKRHLDQFRERQENEDWSLKKEERSKFAAGTLRLDEKGDPRWIANWRRVYEDHYIQNLLAAGLPWLGTKDGETYP